jgi:hypothetical protein
MAAIVFIGLRARTRIDGADFEASFTEDFESGAAARAGADYHDVVDFIGHGQLLA